MRWADQVPEPTYQECPVLVSPRRPLETRNVEVIRD